MNQPTPIAEFLREKAHRCKDCGAEYLAVTFATAEIVTWSRCEMCAAKHFAQAKADEDARLRAREEHRKLEAEQQVILERKRVMDALAVPPLYAKASLDTFTIHGTPDQQAAQGRMIRFARGYVRDFPDVPGIVAFTGSPGSGKGHVAWSIAQAVAATGKAAKVTKLSDMVRTLRASWGKKSDESELAALERYRVPALLVIDEVSRHAFYGEPVQHLYDVIDHRTEQMRPTILTSNEGDAGLAGILSPALWNRIEGHGGLIDFGTASWRSR
jgi:putative replication protein